MRMQTHFGRRYATAALMVMIPIISAVGQQGDVPARGNVVTLAERSFVDAFSQGRYNEAYDALRGLQLFSEAELDSLRDQTSDQLGRAAASFGGSLGWELVSVSRAGARLEQSVYLVYYELLPLRIRFVWYEAAAGWRLYTLVWNDEVSNLLEWE